MGLEKVADRQALDARREPYWQPISSGRHIGYRKTDDVGHWIARNYDPATRKRSYKALDGINDKPGNQQFSEAVAAAREWFAHLDHGGSSSAGTVREACTEYVRYIRTIKQRPKAASDAETRFRRMIDNDPIAKIAITKLKAPHLVDWRGRLIATPAAPAKRGDKCRIQTPPPPPRSRSLASHNRDMTVLRAALNLAKKNGHVISDQAWTNALAPFKKANGRRTLYLTRDQRRALIANLPADLADFASGLCLLPLRPGALASLRVSNFDQRTGILAIDKDKEGEGRGIPLPESATALLRKQAKSKLPGASLFTRADGKEWNKDMWKKPIAEAAAAAGLPGGTTAYTLRHSGITDLVEAGLDLFTVAKLSGTSVAMIEQYYGKLRQERAREALNVLTL